MNKKTSIIIGIIVIVAIVSGGVWYEKNKKSLSEKRDV